MAKVIIDVGGDDKDVQAALDRVSKKLVQLEEQNRKLVQQSKEAAKAAKQQGDITTEISDKWISGLRNLALTYVSIQGAIQLVNSELERQKKLQDDVAGRYKDVAAAEREFIVNAGAISASQRDAALGRVNQIAQQRNIPRVEALRAASAGIGFAGQVDPTLGALDVAARLNPYDVASLTPGLLATRNVTRSEDPLSNLGFLVGVQQTSPIKSTSLLAENLIPAAAGVRLYGDTDVEAASLVNALGFALTDPTGQQSGTAAQRLSAVLAKELPQFGSTRERIEYLQKNPAAARRVSGKIEQGATKAALVSLISDSSSQASQAFRESLGSIPAADQRRAVAEAAIANAGGTTVQQVSELDRGLAAGTESVAFGNTRAARAGVIRERLDELSTQIGESSLSFGTNRFFGGVTEFFGGDPIGIQEARAQQYAGTAARTGQTEALSVLKGLLEEIRAMRGDTSKALRQNATNDLQTHTEGR